MTTIVGFPDDDHDDDWTEFAKRLNDAFAQSETAKILNESLRRAAGDALAPLNATLQRLGTQIAASSGLHRLGALAAEQSRVAGIFAQSSVALAEMQEVASAISQRFAADVAPFAKQMQSLRVDVPPASLRLVVQLADEGAHLVASDPKLNARAKVRAGIALLIVTLAGAATGVNVQDPLREQIRVHVLLLLATLGLLLQLYPLDDD